MHSFRVEATAETVERCGIWRGWENARGWADACSDPREFLSSSRRKRSRVTLRGRLEESFSQTCKRHKMAAATATGSRDYCVINANYRAVPCHRARYAFREEWIAAFCVHTGSSTLLRIGRSDMTRRKIRKRRRKRSGRNREIERRDGAGTPRRCCGLPYTRERDIMALLQSAYITGARASSLRFVPWRITVGLRSRSLFASRFLPFPSSFSPQSPSFLLSMVSAYVQAYTLSSVFLTEADSGMHDGPKVSLNTPPPRESTPPRVYPRWSPRRNRSESSGFRCRLLALHGKKRYGTIQEKLNALDLSRSTLQTCRIHNDIIAVV